MAYAGWSTSNYILATQSVATGAPLTMAAWARSPTPASSGSIFSLANSASAIDRNCVIIYQRGSDRSIAIEVASGSDLTAISASGTIVADSWYHAAAVYSSPTSYSAFLNGKGKATGSTSRTPSGINNATIGLQKQASSGTPFNGSLAEVAVWNAALTDQEIAVLATGMPASAVRPQSLVFYLPLVRELVDLMGNAPFAKVGSPAAAEHCRIYGPCA